jgi:hypothetical protein
LISISDRNRDTTPTFTDDLSEGVISDDLDLGRREFISEFVICVSELGFVILALERD